MIQLRAWRPPLPPRTNQHFSSLGCKAVGSPTSSASSRHPWRIKTTRGFLSRDLGPASLLLAEVFGPGEACGDGAGGDESTASQLTAYQLRLMGALQLRAVTEGPHFTTLLAYASESLELGAPLCLAGMATVAPGLGPAGVDDCETFLNENYPVASVSNMAVSRLFRRQGLGRQLLKAAENSTQKWPRQPKAIALSVYRHNVAAVNLYASEGYVVDKNWMDKRWLSSAEKGQVGFQQRVLMVKKR